MNNQAYINLSKIIEGLSGQWFYAVNTDIQILADFLQRMNFRVYTIDGGLITDEESLFREVEKALNFDPFHRPIANWGMWDEYWDEFVRNSNSMKIAIIYKDSDVFYEIDAQLFLRSVYDILNIVLGLERRPHDLETHNQAVLFIHGKSKGYKIIKSDKFIG